VTEWDGRGMPPVIDRRIARFENSRSRASLLSAQDAAAIKAVDLEPVGDVMGCTVQQITPPYTFAPYADYQGYAEARQRGYRIALDRLRHEATRLHADGVIGIRLTTEVQANSIEEFVALGTAVRARGGRLPRTGFRTELPGPDVAKLLFAGWAPVDLVFALAIRTRLFSPQSRQQLQMAYDNFEVDAHTTVVTAARAAARADFGKRVAQAHGEGAIISSMSLVTWSDPMYYLVAQAGVFGTALARYTEGRPPAPASTLTIMPLNAGRRRK